MELIKAVKIIGSLVLAIVKLGIPFLGGLSFAFNWFPLIKTILIFITLGMVVMDTITIYMQVDN